MNTTAPIQKRPCTHCGSTTYRSGTLMAHVAAMHASKAVPMAPRYCRNCGSSGHTFCNR